MNYTIIKGYQHDSNLRKSFNELAIKTFGLNFENWFQSGYWKDKYIPYSIIYNNKIIANVSASLMDFKYLGKEKHYNRFSKKVDIKNKPFAENIPMITHEELASFLEEKGKRTSYGIFEMECDDLLMFYLTQFMRNCVYYIEKTDTYVIAEVENNILVLYDIFSNNDINLDDIYKAFGKDINQVIFNFTPKDTTGLTKFKVNEEDTTFFIFGKNIEEDMKTLKTLPELAKA